MKKKLIAGLTAFMMTVFSLTASAQFYDMPKNLDLQRSIERAVENGLLQGYEDGGIHPDSYITRAQMASVIVRLLGYTNTADLQGYHDVEQNQWYYRELSIAVAEGILNGDDQKKLRPEETVTFQECYAILARALYLMPYEMRYSDGSVWKVGAADESCLERFEDKGMVSDWAKPYTVAIVGNGGWNGINSKLNPQRAITRAEFAVLMDALIAEFINEPGTYENLSNQGTVLIRSGDVVIRDFKSPKNLMICPSVGQETVTLEGAVIDGAVVVLGGADPVEDGKGGYRAGNAYVKLQGAFANVRVEEPYINVNCMEAKFTFSRVHSKSMITVLTQ